MKKKRPVLSDYLELWLRGTHCGWIRCTVPSEQSRWAHSSQASASDLHHMQA